jgi:hypothetical protein
MGKSPGAALGAPGFCWDEVAATSKEDDRLEGRLIKDGDPRSAECPPRTFKRNQSVPVAFGEQAVDKLKIYTSKSTAVCNMLNCCLLFYTQISALEIK